MRKQVINAGEIIVNTVYLITIKSNTNWYWEERGNKDSVIIATRTIVHMCLDVLQLLKILHIYLIFYVIKNRNKELFKCIQFVPMINIVTTF